MASTPVASLTDDLIDFGALSVDFRGRAVDPTAVDQVTIASIDLDPATVLERFTTNGLQQADIVDYRFCLTTGQTAVHLSDCALIGNVFDPEVDFPQGDTTWIATVWKLNELDHMEILSTGFMVPTDGEPNTTVAYDNSTANLVFDADLTTPEPLSTRADCDSWGLDWSNVTTDVNGAPYDSTVGDTLRISHVAAEATADVEALLLRLDVEADQTYYADTYGITSFDDLSASAAALDGTPFPGFSTGGTWVVDVECQKLTTCLSPAPLILAVVGVQ